MYAQKSVLFIPKLEKRNALNKKRIVCSIFYKTLINFKVRSVFDMHMFLVRLTIKYCLIQFSYALCIFLVFFFKTKVFKTKSLPSIKFGESLTLKILRIYVKMI